MDTCHQDTAQSFKLWCSNYAKKQFHTLINMSPPMSQIRLWGSDRERFPIQTAFHFNARIFLKETNTEIEFYK